ncbi:MAG: CoA transferase [Actinobacteria bacterium]|nr:CoA transferase [Actinomycetota bacterium]
MIDGLRVVDCSRSLAGAYCSKLLTDLGADVVALGQLPDERRELWTYLRTSQQLLAVDADLAPWLGAADVVIGDRDVPGGPLVRVAISAFGGGGPDSGVELPESVLQARSGALSAHGHTTAAPLTIGNEIGEYTTGVFAALGALTAWVRASRTGEPELVDVSMFEAMQLTMVAYPTLMARFPGGMLGTFRWVMLPGNEPCADGEYVGITTITAAQWRSLLRVVGRDDLCDDEELATMIGRFRRAREVTDVLRAYTSSRRAAQVVEECAAARVPAAVVGNGANLPHHPQLAAREAFVGQPGERWLRPRAPFRFRSVDGELPARELRAPEPVPDEHSPTGRARPAPTGRGGDPSAPGFGMGERPFAGVTVVDFTAFWSGPFATAWLAAMGARVIKVESVQRPDGIRFSSGVAASQHDRFYECSALFHGANLGKEGITLDLGHPDGLAAARRLIERADVVAENFTPRVMDGFGLGYEDVVRLNPRAVMLRIPAFGLTGPWRDRPGFAQTMEQVSGMAFTTGYAGGPPIIPGGLVDPLVGAHAALAVAAALERRAETGEGCLVEVPMLEVAIAITAEQVIEHSAHGDTLGRRGEHGVYACAGDDAWVALDDARDPLDAAARAAWCAERDPARAAAELLAEGVPAAPVVPAFAALDDPQLRAREWWQPIDHPVVGPHEYPGWPMRMSGGPRLWWTGRAPTLGEHTEAVLRELGLDDAAIERLRAEHVIGTEPHFG